MSNRLGIVTRQIVQTLTLAILVLGLLNVAVCVAQQPAADKPPVPEAQPEVQKGAEKKPAAQKPAAQKPAEKKTSEKKTSEPEAAKPETAKPETEVPKGPEAKEAATTEAGQPATEPAVVPPAEGAAPGAEPIVEGPESLAEKFSEILAKRLGTGAAQEPDDDPAPEPDVTEAAPEQDPADAAAPVELEAPTINVLVLRNPDDLMDVKPTDRIGQLILSGDEFTNRSLRNLKGFTISELSIEAVNVSSAGLQYLKEVQGIRRLRLWSPGLDDQALKHVAELTDLQILDIEGTAVVGTSLGELKGLKFLETLVLGPKFSDSQIGDLEQLPALRQIDMRACGRLTLAGVESLGKLVDLKLIWLPRHIRTKGKRALKVTLPECQIRS